MTDRRYKDRVRVLKELGDWRQIEELARARFASKADSQSLTDLCWSLLLLGRIPEFDVYFAQLSAKAGKSLPTSPGAILRLSAFRAFETKDYPRALEFFRKLADATDSDPGPRLKIADTLLLLQRFEEARREIEALQSLLGKADPRLRRLECRLPGEKRTLSVAGESERANIVLFVPYFEADNAERRKEIAQCLERNLQCQAIDHIYLLLDADASLAHDPARVTILHLSHRPTYADWVRLSYELCRGQISVFANADIYFDSSIESLRKLFRADPNAFVALSRREVANGKETMHPNPHWSQDSWAFAPSEANPARDGCLNFPVGVPRCDNKVAYVFGVYGHTVYNPCREIRAVHLHESGLRTYDKKSDARIVGGMAMVHASEDLLSPAKLDIELWPVATAQFAKATINGTLERWRQTSGSALSALVVRPGLIAFDDHWQFPAITEQHAFRQMAAGVPRQAEAAYIGFPWATLIDLVRYNNRDQGRLDLLFSRLNAIAKCASAYRRVVTVCQHIWMLEHLEILRSVGITDIFWSHATTTSTSVPGAKEIAIHAFPLYPVQIAEHSVPLRERRHLFSFVGAKANGKYLTQVRNLIREELSGDSRGVVIERESWHYNQIVYDGQILKRKAVCPELVDGDAGGEFRRIMEQTMFTLCPSGTGPNSIRLWEAVASGSIPVVLSETYRHPGPSRIWTDATIACGETRDAIRGLPSRLEAIVANGNELERRLEALHQLAERYGRSNFVVDILDLVNGRTLNDAVPVHAPVASRANSRMGLVAAASPSRPPALAVMSSAASRSKNRTERSAAPR